MHSRKKPTMVWLFFRLIYLKNGSCSTDAVAYLKFDTKVTVFMTPILAKASSQCAVNDKSTTHVGFAKLIMCHVIPSVFSIIFSQSHEMIEI